MANPQKENGFTPIANEIMEQLCKMRLNGTQFRIILVLLRYTYGFNRKSHEFSETFIANATGTNKRVIVRELKSLVDYGLVKIVSESTFTKPRILSFNKNYEGWEINQQLTNILPVDRLVNTTDDQTVNTTDDQLVTQERKYINKNINKDIKKDYSCSEQKNAHEPAVISLPLNNKTDYDIFNDDIVEWQELYPSVDIIQELRKMKGWLNSNPTRRKTKSGIKRFINSWLSREQDAYKPLTNNQNKGKNLFLNALKNERSMEL